MVEQIKCFKPCYKWNAFNTELACKQNEQEIWKF